VKIIVTGAIGHIGSYIIRDLGKNFPGANIVMIDNMMTQRFPSLFNLPLNVNYSFLEGDVSQMELMPIFSGANVVIHLAAITDAAGSFDKAEELEANNYQSTFRVARACIEVKACLIALSSTSVYGTQKKQVDENCPKSDLQPQSPYARIKLKEEELIKNLIKMEGLKAIHCRFGTIFGTSPGMRFHTAVNKFCWQAVMCQPISVWTTAYDQKRPYLDLLDASQAIIYIIKNNIFDGQIYNVSTQNSTVRDVVETIKDFVPSLKIEFVDNRIMNQLSYDVVCDRFKSKGFVFSGNLRKGIKETIDLLKNSNI
jgi:UDP-glucose 4-epimerase